MVRTLWGWLDERRDERAFNSIFADGGRGEMMYHGDEADAKAMLRYLDGGVLPILLLRWGA